ncbi:unnamed protein product [Mytilus coruscus]|uniref:Exonuclease domain-containing protein n=1 Tax=Mytilus coruscus TaxID=42192 RepID=A0A6J8ADZ9_MYTCO|nr:unnamed protein product [Mytilus coruscus]
MINAGMGPSHVNNFLTGCNIPPVDASTLRKKQKELAPVIIEAAEASCKEAQREELECSGHASLIGVNTGKVVEFDVRTRNCSICQYHIGKNEPKPPHECNVNWTGSSKGMEPDMACSMIQRLAEDGYTVLWRTKSLKARVSSAVMQKNEGYGWLSKVNKKSLLSPGHLTILHGIRKDRRPKQIRKTQSTTNFKRKRLTIKGDTYGGEIEVQEHIDTETIPSKMKFEGEESVVVFDLETTGLSRKSDITQLAAFDGTTVFNEYVSPREVISPKVSELTGLTFDFSCDQMYHHGIPVESRDIQIVLLKFIDFISKKKKPILFGHNIAAFDIPILMNKLRQHSLLSEFLLHIYGCIDTIKLAKRKFKTKDIGNHKQQTLVTKLLGIEYDAHNACADVTSLFQLEHFEYSEKDVFPFNAALLTDSYIPLIRASHITKLTARQLAHSGLCLKHLQLAFNRDSENGLKSILLEHGFNAKTVTSFTKYFTCTEE